MNTINNNSSNLILKKVRVRPDVEARIKKYRVQRIAATGNIINVNDSLAEIIEKGLQAEGLGPESE